MLVLLSVGVVYYAILFPMYLPSKTFKYVLNSGQSSDSNADMILYPVDTKVFLKKREVNSSHVKEHCVPAVSISVP